MGFEYVMSRVELGMGQLLQPPLHEFKARQALFNGFCFQQQNCRGWCARLRPSTAGQSFLKWDLSEH